MESACKKSKHEESRYVPFTVRSIDIVESGNIWKHHENKFLRFLSVERMMNFELSGAV